MSDQRRSRRARVSPLGAGVRSAFLPGWGQYAQGRKETAMDQWVRDGLQAPPWLKDAVTSAGVVYLD